jgi:hypothetical protein
MKIKRLGRTGLKISEVCLGTMTFGMRTDRATSHAILSKAANLAAHPLQTRADSPTQNDKQIQYDHCRDWSGRRARTRNCRCCGLLAANLLTKRLRLGQSRSVFGI